MNKAPAYQHYCDKAVAGTMHLSDGAFKGYWLALWWMWQHARNKCSIPDTDEAWRIATSIEDAEKRDSVRKEIMSPVMPLLVKKGKVLYSKGLQKEAKKQKAWRKKSSEGGKARHKAASEKELRGKGGSTTVPTKGQPKVNSPSPSPSPSSSSTNKKEKGLAANPPSEKEVKEYSESIGYESLDAEGFIAYYQTQGWKLSNGRVMKDWKACVVTWKKRDAKSSGAAKKETDPGMLDYAKQFNILVEEQPGDDSFQMLYRKARENYGKDGVKRLKAAAKQIKEKGGMN